MSSHSTNDIGVTVNGDKIDVTLSRTHGLIVRNEKGFVLFRKEVIADENNEYQSKNNVNNDSGTKKNESNVTTKCLDTYAQDRDVSDNSTLESKSNPSVVNNSLRTNINAAPRPRPFQSYTSERCELLDLQHTRLTKQFNWRNAYNKPSTSAMSTTCNDRVDIDNSCNDVEENEIVCCVNNIDMDKTRKRSRKPRDMGGPEDKEK